MSSSNDAIANDSIAIKAAVVRSENCQFDIEDLSLEAPRDNEILVKIAAVGMCHTDIVVGCNHLPVNYPAVLGHEGSGVVERVGKGVTKVAPGDHVVLSFRSCGACEQCQSGHPAHCLSAFPINFSGAREDGSHAIHNDAGESFHDRFFGQSSFGSYALATERNVVKVSKDAPLELLGPLGCGIQTGAGSVINGLKVGLGQTFAVFGAGAVGLSAVMAAKLSAASTIIAVDLVDSRLEMAKSLGATHVINGKDPELVDKLVAITGIGLHFALDTTGNVNVIRNAVDALRPGGTCGILGASPAGAELKLDVLNLMSQAKCIRGLVEGDSIPDLFIPALVDQYLKGNFPFDQLVKYYELSDINQAVKDSESGVTIKPIIKMPN